MKCFKCNTQLKKDNHICPKCGYDNDATRELRVIDYYRPKKKDKKKNIIIVIMLIFIILCLLIGISVFPNIENHPKNGNIPLTTTQTTTNSNKTYKFTYENLSFEYNKMFKRHKNSLIYKDNEDINIVINKISLEQYSNMINSNDCLDSKLNEITTKTFAGDLFYSHLFMINNSYYELTINYVDDVTVYTEALQLEISKIINSIKTNK